jgi:hypothetical protein
VKKMNSSLQGMWAFSGSSDETEQDFLHIFEDGRMVQINCQPPPSGERRVISLRGCSEGDGIFRIRTKPETLGYVVRIRLVDGHLEIKYPDKTLTGRPVDVRELPTWYAAELAKAVWEDKKN